MKSSSSSSPSSTLSSMKTKTQIHTLIFSHVCRILRAFSKAKSILIQVFRENQPSHLFYTTKKQKKILFGSFRLHYNWCSSSHVLPVPAPMVLDGFSSVSNHLYYDSAWNSVISTDQQHEDIGAESQLSGYLQWLEEKVINDDEKENIDRLADMFIASCHEKFRLEKQESYRRFQEMLARSM